MPATPAPMPPQLSHVACLFTSGGRLERCGLRLLSLKDLAIETFEAVDDERPSEGFKRPSPACSTHRCPQTRIVEQPVECVRARLVVVTAVDHQSVDSVPHDELEPGQSARDDRETCAHSLEQHHPEGSKAARGAEDVCACEVTRSKPVHSAGKDHVLPQVLGDQTRDERTLRVRRSALKAAIMCLTPLRGSNRPTNTIVFLSASGMTAGASGEKNSVSMPFGIVRKPRSGK